MGLNEGLAYLVQEVRDYNGEVLLTADQVKSYMNLYLPYGHRKALRFRSGCFANPHRLLSYAEVGARLFVTRERARQIYREGIARLCDVAMQERRPTLFTLIQHSGLDNPVANALRRNGYATLGAVNRLTDEQLLELRNFGPKSARKLRQFLAGVSCEQ